LLSSAGAITTKRPPILVLALLALCTLLADPSGAGARGKPRDCKPGGAPVAVGSQGAIEVAEPVQYSGENHILAADKAVKPTKLHLISPSGEAIELPSPPWTMEPSRWLSRGRAVYAVGTGRSQTQGKTDVVLVRWGNDSRPRLSKIATVDSIAAAPRAALVDEFMAVLWAEGSASGAPRTMASFIDVEELKIGEPQALGAYTKGGFTELSGAGKGFMAVWSSDAGLMRARFDLRGKSSTPASALTWKTPAPVLGAIACGERTWLLHEGGSGKLGVSTEDKTGALARVADVASSDHTRTPLLCADESVVIGHRTIHEKAGNVVFWISTVEPSGKKHERRVKDVAGNADTIRMPLLAEAGEQRSAFWVEGGGHDARLWSRPIVCE